MKITLKKNIALSILLTSLMLPVVAYGASLIPCGQPEGTEPISVAGVSYPTTNACGFNDLIILANTIIHFLMYDVAVPLAALGFVFVGGKLVLNQEKESAWSEAKESFWNIGKGFVIMLGAYVLIKTVLFNFLNVDAGFTSFLLQ